MDKPEVIHRPCPFCGSSGDRVFPLWDNFDGGHTSHVHCFKCMTNGPDCFANTAEDAIRAAIKAWNGRAT